ncbi:MAG: MarC family protein [Propylenella sp.]
MLDQALSAFVTLFVTIDPAGLAPVFLALTAGMSRAERAQVALRATLTGLRRAGALRGGRPRHPVGLRHHHAGVPHRRRRAPLLHRLRDDF